MEDTAAAHIPRYLSFNSIYTCQVLKGLQKFDPTREGKKPRKDKHTYRNIDTEKLGYAGLSFLMKQPQHLPEVLCVYYIKLNRQSPGY